MNFLLLFFFIKFFSELWEDTDDYPDGVGIHDVASISSSETTESSESFETDNYPRAVDEVKKIFEQENFQKKNKNESLCVTIFGLHRLEVLARFLLELFLSRFFLNYK